MIFSNTRVNGWHPFARGEPFENEVRFRRADGQFRWHLCRGVPLRDEAGNIVKWYGVLTDVEERKQAEFYLSKASRLATMAELSASIAHELNQPFMSVLANAQAGKRWLAANLASYYIGAVGVVLRRYVLSRIRQIWWKPRHRLNES